MSSHLTAGRCTKTNSLQEDKCWLFIGDPRTGVWIGGSENGHARRWSWFPTGQLVQWFDWGPGKPNSIGHCMYMVYMGKKGYQWANFHCGFEVCPTSKVSLLYSKVLFR